MTFAVRKYFHLTHAAICIDAHGVGDALELANDLIDQKVAQQGAALLDKTHLQTRRLWFDTRRCQLLGSCGIKSDVAHFKGIRLPEHELLRLLRIHVIHSQRTRRGQRHDCSRCVERDAHGGGHQNAQPRPTLKRLASLLTLKFW